MTQKKEDAPMTIACRFDESHAEAWQNHLKWLSDKLIGEPEGTSTYTVEQLKEMGYVGVYSA